MGWSMKIFNIFLVHRKIWVLGVVHEKKQYIGGIGQIVDGGLGKKEGVVFLRGLISQCTLWIFYAVHHAALSPCRGTATLHIYIYTTFDWFPEYNYSNKTIDEKIVRENLQQKWMSWS